MSDIIDADTLETTPTKRLKRKMKALSAEECRSILELLHQHNKPLYSKVTRGEFLRLKVLVEKRAR